MEMDHVITVQEKLCHTPIHHYEIQLSRADVCSLHDKKITKAVDYPLFEECSFLYHINGLVSIVILLPYQFFCSTQMIHCHLLCQCYPLNQLILNASRITKNDEIDDCVVKLRIP